MDRFQVTPSLAEFFIDSGKTATLTNIGTATIYGAADAMFPNVGAAAWSLAPGATRVEDYGTLWVRTAAGSSSTLTVDPVASGLAVDTGTGVPSAVGSGASGGGIRDIAAGNLGATYTLDLSASTEDVVIVEGTLTADCTITISNRRKCMVRLLLAQDATGNRVLTISDGTNTQVVTITATATAISQVVLTLPDATTIYFDAPAGAALPPTNSVAPAVTGTATIGSVLTCSTGTWTHTPTSYAYQWKRNGTNISAATSATYTLVGADGGTSIKCTVTATNAAGSASQDSNTVAPPADASSVAGLVAWFKADAITPVADGTALASWPDSSGNGHALAQATGANQPLYKTAIQNGLPSVRTDGVNDLMAASFTTGTTPTTFIVAKYLSAWSADATILDGTIGFKNTVYRSSSTQMSQYVGSGVAVTTTPEAAHIYVSVLAATPTFAVDAGGPVSNSTAGAESGGITIGSSTGGASPANADIFEVIQYSGPLSSGDRTTVLNYLKTKWGTP